MLHSLLHKIGATILTVGVFVASLFGVHQAPIQQPSVNLGAAPQFTVAKPSSLYGSGVSSSDTTIKLTALVTPPGTAITTAQLVGGVGSVFYITIEPATTKKEIVSCTAVTQNSDGTATLTGCTRGLGFVYPYTAVASLALSHAGGSSVVISNPAQLYNDIIAYVNSSLAAGVNNASLIAKGIGQLASGLQQASSTAIGGGSTDAALLLYSANSTSTYNSATAPLKVVVTQNSGKIDENFLPTTFANNHTLAATTTVNYPASIQDATGNSFLWNFIASTTFVSGNSITLSSIPARKHLHAIIYLELASAIGRSADNRITLNGDSAINYSYSSASTTMVAGAIGQNYINFSDIRTNSDGTYYATMDIMNLSSTTKAVGIHYYDVASGTTTAAFPSLNGTNDLTAIWATSTAQYINQIKVTSSAGGTAYTTNSSIYLYGSPF